MQNNNQLKFWKWAVMLLAALNICLLGSIWLKQSNQASDEMRRPPNGAKAADFLLEQLKFSPEQLVAFEKLKEVHHHSMDSLREISKEVHKLFFDNLKNEKPDTAKVNELARAIANNQTQIELVTFNHFKEVRKLCDEKQKVTFDEIIQEVLRRMARPGPPPPKQKN
ncbi:MAG TPA: Spy/CpxP family protein refolding chaperone [Bacteroidia bacterium]|jgi:protein CpxP|nr:Spy/CpxP family protein refolding chaperone [Bacteroidia bacterium]